MVDNNANPSRESRSNRSLLRIAVIGGGIAGLSAAYKLTTLAKSEGLNLKVTLFESANRTGGVIQSQKRNDRVIEFGPDSMLSAKPAAVELIKEIGLEKDLIPTNTANRRSMVACQGRLYALPEGFVMLAPTRLIPFLLSPLFSPEGKLRMALDLVSPGNSPDKDETVESFVTRRFGREALEKVVQPMVGGIYVGDVSKLSARATLPQFVEMERRFGSVIRGLLSRVSSERSQERTASGARYSMFVSLKNGVQSLVDQLELKIGIENIERTSEVCNIKRSRERWLIESSTANRNQEFDSVIFATPAKVTARIIESIEPVVSEKLLFIESASAAVVNLLYKREDFKHPLDAFGFVVPSSEKRSILAASLISNKFPNRAPEGSVAIRVFLGGVLQPDLLKHSDEGLIDLAHGDLKHYLGVKNLPQTSFVTRYPDSMPQYNLGHQARVDEIMTITRDRMPGVFLTGNSYRGVGIPDCIADALRTAHAVIEYASAPNLESVTS